MFITSVEKFKSNGSTQKKDIRNLPTCVVVRNNQKNNFTTANFDTLPRAEKLLISHETFGKGSSLC